MSENYRNPIASLNKFPQFTTMNVIDGQAGLASYSSLIFYSLTIDNILNIIVLLILAAVTISTLTGDNGILKNATDSKEQTEIGEDIDQIKLAVNASMIDSLGDGVTKANLESNLSKQGLNATVEPEGTDYIVTIRNTAKNTERKYKVKQNGNVTEYTVDNPPDNPPSGGIAVGETAPDNTKQ